MLYEYNIVFGLKSLYGILIFIKKIKDIEKKNMLTDYIKDLLMNNIKTPYLTNCINEKSNIVEKVEIKSENNSYIKLKNEEFRFTNSNLIFINNDLAYLLNENKTLYKLHRLNENKNKYNIVETNEKFLNDDNTFIFSLEKEYLFGFNSDEFGKTQKCIKLLKSEHTKKNITKLEIKMDDISKKIFYESITKPNEIINDIYLSLLSFDEDEKISFLNNYLPNTEIYNNNIAIFQYNNYLYVLHPIYKKNNNSNNEKYYFFSNKFIYVFDQFEIYLNHNKIKVKDDNILYIDYKESFIVKTPLENISLLQDDEKKSNNKFNIDEILKNIKNKNKLILINNNLCFTDTCNNFYDIKNKKISCFETESNENNLVKDISNESKDYLSKSIIAQYDNSIIYLTLLDATLYNPLEIKEKEYIINNNYYKNNIFCKNKNYLKQIIDNMNKVFLKNKKNLTKANNDIFKEIFQTFDDNEEIESSIDKDEEKKDNNINKINESNEDFSNYILSYLCNNIMEANDLNEINNNFEKIKKSENPELFQITKYLKRPFTINIDFPTIKMIEDLIIICLENNKNKNENNLNIFCLLLILDHHLSYLSSLKINSKFLFGNIKNIEILISLLKKIINMNKEYQNICFSLLIKIISITEDYPNDKLNLLFKEILLPIEFIDNPEQLLFYIEVFKYANYSKINMKTLITNESSKKFILDLINIMLENENIINLSYISEFFNEFILFYNNIISYILVNIKGTTFSYFVHALLNIYYNNINEEKIKNPKILKPLIYHLITQCLNNYKLLQNDFYLQNWSYIYDILYILQKIRYSISLNNQLNEYFNNKKDFILDTFNFSSEFPGNKYKEIYFGKLSCDQPFNEEENNKNKEKEEKNVINTNENKTNIIYMQFISILKSQTQFNKKTSTNNIL